MMLTIIILMIGTAHCQSPNKKWVKHTESHLPRPTWDMAVGHYDDTIYLLYVCCLHLVFVFFTEYMPCYIAVEPLWTNGYRHRCKWSLSIKPPLNLPITECFIWAKLVLKLREETVTSSLKSMTRRYLPSVQEAIAFTLIIWRTYPFSGWTLRFQWMSDFRHVWRLPTLVALDYISPEVHWGSEGQFWEISRFWIWTPWNGQMAYHRWMPGTYTVKYMFDHFAFCAKFLYKVRPTSWQIPDWIFLKSMAALFFHFSNVRMLGWMTRLKHVVEFRNRSPTLPCLLGKLILGSVTKCFFFHF